jgi:uncharacterized protein
MTPSHRHADANGLWVDTHDLPRRAGTMRTVRFVAGAPADLGIEMIRVPQDSPVTFELRLESVVEGILVTGQAEADLVGECSRCLGPLEDHQVFELQELFYYPGQDAEEDASFVVDEHIDLDAALRDAVVLALPFQPLCRDDCAGLCSECGANLNDDPGHNHGEKVDPRWVALQGLDIGENDD